MAYPQSPATNLPQYQSPNDYNQFSGGSTPKPAMAPKNDISPLPGGGAIPSSVSQYMNPYVAPFTGPAPIRPGSNPNPAVNLNNLDSARSTVAWQPAGGGQQEVQVAISETGGTSGDDGGSWRDRLYAERAAAQNRSSYAGGGGSAGGPNANAPMEAIKAPDLPEYNAPGYAPPDEDPNVYKQTRREEMGAGMRELREGTREAISSAQSLDNPNARAKFVQQSLKGYGQGLEKVASGASRAGRAEANRKRTDQLETYRVQHSIKSDNYLKNYQNEINVIAADFASEQAAQTANFNAGISNPGSTGGARDKSTYYGNGNMPFMGYM